MINIERKRSDPKFYWVEPKDMLTWIVVAAMERGDPREDTPEKIAQRLLFLILGGIHTSILTTTNLFLDLLSSPPEFDYYSRLREEADQVFATGDDWTNQTSLPKLIYADSTIRETLRRSPVISRSVLREVIPKDGLVMPNGQHIPTGAWMAVPSVGVHYDEKFYPKPQLYNPFRFVPPAVEAPAQIEDGADSREPNGDVLTTSIPRKHEGLSTASETYLAFGYGRHSCPGRWLVALQLKLLLAYIVSHYDFDPIHSRPPNWTFGQHIIPRAVNVKVRRRKGCREQG